LLMLVPVALLLAAGSFTRMQLGIRYVLPAFPLLCCFAGQGARWINFARWPWRSGVLVAAMVLAPCSLRYHPHYLPYFNELSGGPEEGRLHLVDSNLDWGQDLDRLRELLRRRGIPIVGLAYFGTVPPADRGIAYQLPPAGQPAPGVYAISVNFVQGRPFMLRTPEGGLHAAGLDDYGYFRFFEPVDRAGWSILVYQIQHADVARWQQARAAASIMDSPTR